ncbi:MAG: hypothetical protein V4850_06050 [Myxococcota bacterium]
MSQAGGDKAYFESLDDGGIKFTVQYNPKEFQVNKAMTWEESKTQGKAVNPISFQKGAPMTASFDLLFDTTGESSAVNVQDAWVTGLLALTNATATPGNGEEAELQKKRPHALVFTWGAFTMKCVIESVNVTYLMFASSGEAVRARCSVKLKEWTPLSEVDNNEKFGANSGGSAWGTGSIVLVGSGQTLSQIAQASGSDMRTVAAANGITDPMADMTGLEIKV